MATAVVIFARRSADGDVPRVCSAVGCASTIGVDIYDHLNVPDPWPANVGSVRVCIDSRCQTLRHRPGRPNRNSIDIESFTVHARARQRHKGLRVPARVEVRDPNGTVIATRATQIQIGETFPNGHRCPPRCFGGGARFVLRTLEFQRPAGATRESRRLVRVARRYTYRSYRRPQRGIEKDDRCDTWRSTTARQYECVISVGGIDGYLLVVFVHDTTGLRLAGAGKDFDPDIPLHCDTARLPPDVSCEDPQ